MHRPAHLRANHHSTRGEQAIAAIDVGSNAIRLQIMGVRPSGSLVERESLREPVRLGHRVFLTGYLEQDGIDRAVSVLSAFRAAMVRHEVVQSRCVATSAVREAQNKTAFLDQVKNKVNLQLEVISGAEEARLLTVAIQRKIDISKTKALLVDIGGGSVEFAIVYHGKTIFSQSQRLGAVRLSELFLENSKKPTDRATILIEYLERMLGETLQSIRKFNPRICLSIGGNAETIGRIAGDAPDDAAEAGPFVSARALREITKKLTQSSAGERAKHYDLRADRVDTIVPASILLNFVVEKLKLNGFYAPGVGLRDGILAELADDVGGRADARQVERNILDEAERLGRHYQYDSEHAKKVREFSLLLYERLLGRGKLASRIADRDRLILAAAATIHDIGEFVDYANHHKHGYYLITNSEIGGLTGDEMRIIALTVRYHRRALPSERHPEFTVLSREEKSRVSRLAGILRVADALDREHRQKIQSLSLTFRRGELGLRPVAKGDLALERWALATKDELFQKEFGFEPRLGSPVARVRKLVKS